MLFLYVICLLKFPDSKLWTWHFGSAVLLEFQVEQKRLFHELQRHFRFNGMQQDKVIVGLLLLIVLVVKQNCLIIKWQWSAKFEAFGLLTMLRLKAQTIVSSISMSLFHTLHQNIEKKVQKLKYFICCPNKFRMNIFQEIRQIEGICDLTGFFCFLAFRNLLGVWGTTQLFPKVLRTKIGNLAGCVSRCRLFSVTQLFPSNKFNVHWIWQLCKYYFRIEKTEFEIVSLCELTHNIQCKSLTELRWGWDLTFVATGISLTDEAET